MAIVFDWYENPNASSEEEAALHPRIFMNGKVDTDTLSTEYQSPPLTPSPNDGHTWTDWRGHPQNVLSDYCQGEI